MRGELLAHAAEGAAAFRQGHRQYPRVRCPPSVWNPTPFSPTRLDSSVILPPVCRAANEATCNPDPQYVVLCSGYRSGFTRCLIFLPRSLSFNSCTILYRLARSLSFGSCTLVYFFAAILSLDSCTELPLLLATSATGAPSLGCHLSTRGDAYHRVWLARAAGNWAG